MSIVLVVDTGEHCACIVDTGEHCACSGHW